MINDLIDVGTSRLTNRFFPIESAIGRKVAVIATVATNILSAMVGYYWRSSGGAIFCAFVFCIVNAMIGGPELVNRDSPRTDRIVDISSSGTSSSYTSDDDTSDEDITDMLNGMTPQKFQGGLQLMESVPKDELLDIFNASLQRYQAMPEEERARFEQNLFQRLRLVSNVNNGSTKTFTFHLDQTGV